MDEPLSALDKKLRDELQHEIRRIHHQTDVTILYVTHDQDEALRLSDRIAVFSKGRIDQVGTGPELYANPNTRFVAEFIGDSDFLSCKLLNLKTDRADVVLGDDFVVRDVPLHGRLEGTQTGALFLRPERLDLLRREPGDFHALPVEVEDITFLGSNIHVVARTGWGENLSVRLPFGDENITGLSCGDKVWLRFKTHEARVFA